MILVPAELIDANDFDSHSVIDGEAYAQFALPVGKRQSISLANGGLLSTDFSSDSLSLNIRSASGNHQSVVLIPGENGSYELKYTSNGIVTSSLVVKPISNKTVAYTTLDGSGLKVREDLFVNDSLMTLPLQLSAFQGPPLTNKASSVEDEVQAGPPPIGAPLCELIQKPKSGDPGPKDVCATERGHKVITFLTQLNKVCQPESEVTIKPSALANSQPVRVSKLTVTLRQAATRRLDWNQNSMSEPKLPQN